MSGPPGRLADVVEFSCVDGPGNRFVAFLQGCNFECVACHNPHTIPIRRGREVSVEQLVEQVRPLAGYLSGITVSGGEATIQHGFVRSLFRRIKSDPDLCRLTTFIDSNGSAPPSVWDELLPVTDGVMIDLKAFDPETHHLLTGRSNTSVRRSIELLAAAGKLYEVRLLLVPGFNDDDSAIRRAADWLRLVAPTARVKLIGFRAHGTLPPAAQWDDESEVALDEAAGILRARGFDDVVVV